MGDSDSPALSRPDLDRTVRPLERMLGALRTPLRSRSYGLILTFGGKGFAGSIVGEVADRIAHEAGHADIRKGALRDVKDPGSIRDLQGDLDDILAGMGPGKRVLIAVDRLTTGAHVAALGELLTEKAIPFDIAAFDAKGYRSGRNDSPAASEGDVRGFLAFLRDAASLPPLSPSDTNEIMYWLRYSFASSSDLRTVEQSIRNGTFTVWTLPQSTAQGGNWNSQGWGLGLNAPDEAARLGLLVQSAHDLRADPSLLADFERLVASNTVPANRLSRWFMGSAWTRDSEARSEPLLRETYRTLERESVPLVLPQESGIPVDGSGIPLRSVVAQGVGECADDADSLFGQSWRSFLTWDSPGSAGYGDESRTRKKEHIPDPPSGKDLDVLATHLHERLRYEGTVVPKLVKPLSKLLSSLKQAVVDDEFSVIIGDDTSGRVPALMIGRAINAYRERHGLPKLPIVFIEGTKRPHDRAQIRSFEKRRQFLPDASQGKRALIVTERVGSGQNVGSIMERLHDLGIPSDVACLGGMSQGELDRVASGGWWRPGVRTYLSNGNPDIVLDKRDVSGLRNPNGEKFSPHPVITGDAAVRRTVDMTRRDILASVRTLVQGLE